MISRECFNQTTCFVSSLHHIPSKIKQNTPFKKVRLKIHHFTGHWPCLSPIFLARKALSVPRSHGLRRFLRRLDHSAGGRRPLRRHHALLGQAGGTTDHPGPGRSCFFNVFIFFWCSKMLGCCKVKFIPVGLAKLFIFCSSRPFFLTKQAKIRGEDTVFSSIFCEVILDLCL